MDHRYDAIVVGGGAMGAATAWQLAGRGRDVLLLERFEAGHVRGSSHGPTRIFRVAYRDPRYVALAVASIPLWRRLEEEVGEVLVDQVGQIDHGAPLAVDEIEAALTARGCRAERLTPSEATDRWPGMRFAEAVVFSADGGRAYADATVAALHRRARELGADVRFGTKVERIEIASEGAVVLTATASYRAPVVVVAAGAWASDLLGRLAPVPPLTVTREQTAHFRPLERDTSGWPSFIHHTAPAGADEHVLSFGAYGMWTPGVGVKVGVEGTGMVVHPDTRTFEPDPAGLATLAGYAREWLPGVEPEPLEATTCLWTGTPDEHFVLDKRGPVVVCSPCSGHGFKFVPIIGRITADLALGASQPEPAWRLRT